MATNQLLTGALFFFLLSPLNCRKQNIMPDAYADKHVVNVGECKNISQGLSICYNSVVYESRCPEDVVCVWAGLAIIRVEMTIDGEDHSLYMTTEGPSIPGYETAVRDTTIKGYNIAFVDLLPYPKANPPKGYQPDTKAIFDIKNQ